MNELKKAENTVNFEALAAKIKKERSWSEPLMNDTLICIYTHALFNQRIFREKIIAWAERYDM